MPTFKIQRHSRNYFPFIENLRRSIQPLQSDINYYILKETKRFDFVDKLDLSFTPLSTEFNVDPNSNTFITLNLFYKFEGFSPDFNVEVVENVDGKEEILYSEREGLSSYPDMFNKLYDHILVFSSTPENIIIRLSKKDTTTNSIWIKQNSFYSMEKKYQFK